MSVQPASTLRRPTTWRRLGLLALLLVVAAGVGAFAGLRRRQAPQPPALDLADADPAVAALIESAQDKVRQAPRDSRAWGWLGKVLYAHGYYAEAAECFRHAQHLDPNEPRWPYFRGTALAIVDPPAALPELRRALQLWGDDPVAPRLRLADQLLVQGQFDEAEEQFGAVLAKEPKNALAHLGLARVSSERDDPRRALKHLENCLADPATEKPARALRAEHLQRLGDHEEAAREGRLAGRLPDGPVLRDPFFEEVARLQVGLRASLARAHALMHEGRSQEGSALLLETVQNYPNATDAWLAVGRLFLSQGNFAQAEQALRPVLAKHPELVEGWFYLGAALLEQGKPVEAAKHFRRATELRPDYPEAHHNLGRCLVKQGKRADAIEAYRQAVRYNPAFVLAHVDLAELLALDGRPAEAREHLELALSLGPDDKKVKQLLETFRGPARP